MNVRDLKLFLDSLPENMEDATVTVCCPVPHLECWLNERNIVVYHPLPGEKTQGSVVINGGIEA